MAIRYCEHCGISSKDKRVSLWSEFNRTLCQKHYWQLKKYGRILNRTENDPNEIIIHDEYAEIVLYNKVPAGIEPTEKARTKISLYDIGRVRDIKWKLMSNGYVFNNEHGLLSRFILNMGDYEYGDLEADHIDNNPLNNKRENLRKATSAQQKQNTRRIKTGESKYKGVAKSTKGDRWVAVIRKNGKRYRMGLFEKEKKAAIEYDKKAIELFGDFANTNFPVNQYIKSKEEAPCQQTLG